MRILQTGVTHFDPDRATPGFTLFSPLWGHETLILDMRGEVVHRWDFPVGLGGVLMEDRKVLTLDEHEVIKTARAIAARIDKEIRATR